MSRSYTTFREMQPFTDDSKKASYSTVAPSDHVHNPVIVDAEAMQTPIIRYVSGANGETYVIKAEKIVQHSIVPAPVSRFLVAEYRYNSEQLGKEELFRDYGVEKQYTPLGSTYHLPEKAESTLLDSDSDRPEKVEEFITKVVTEASRGPTTPVAVPMSSARHSGSNQFAQENPRKYGDERDFRGDSRKKLNGNPTLDGHNEPYLNNKGANTYPMVGNNRDVYDFYGRPRGNEGHNARNHPLSKPTNDLGPAMEFLKEATKPSYGSGKEEFNARAQTEASRPTRTIPLGSTRLPTSSKLSGSESKIESKDDDPKEEEENNPHLRRGKRDELKMMNNRGGAKPLETKDGYEKPKGNVGAVQLGQTRFPGSTMQKKEQNSYPETIDSREASRRYGKSSSRALEEEEYEGIINSREAMMKYNGAFVP